ncbi:MAG: 16S rRNA (uracil(1498)-N(3))-methyltransferase [Cytophagaceae bacterium BCCC1]|nr:MAG: 16S rRNA (uracil(1498)-N(3))-methyltransferase [Cytophagaceae bacterium BCCC1]
MDSTKIDFLFYSPEIEKSKCLDSVDSLHAVKVLRKKQGDIIQVTDGIGGWYRCSISDPNPKACKLDIIDFEKDYKAPKRRIFVGICPTKNADRIEYFIEKSVEIGISGIFFIKTQHTYPKKINIERFKKIAISGMKQSLKAYMPEMNEMVSFNSFLKESSRFSQKMIAHLDDQATEITKTDLNAELLILIGPEGDFSKEELKMAKENNFKTVTLGENRLRTETAGVVAVSILNLL